MNRHTTRLIALITLVITPAAVAEIYKCDGPDGPVYSDRKCGSDAVNLELTESSGLSGVTEQDKAVLAEKKEIYSQQGLSEEEIEKKLFWDATTFDLMKKWRAVHLPITLVFAVLGITHILSIFLFWQWK